ncbi:MAG: hypothetical protein WCT11_03990 [Candidatus Magasanikbacteria bacterium]
MQQPMDDTQESHETPNILWAEDLNLAHGDTWTRFSLLPAGEKIKPTYIQEKTGRPHLNSRGVFSEDGGKTWKNYDGEELSQGRNDEYVNMYKGYLQEAKLGEEKRKIW